MVVGVDIVPDAIAAATAAAAAAGVSSNCRFIMADAFELFDSCNVNASGASGAPITATSMAHSGDGSDTPRDICSDRNGGAAGADMRTVPGRAEEAAPAMVEPGSFDFVYDCQAFHVLREVDEPRAAQVYATALKVGGTMLCLVGNADEPECGLLDTISIVYPRFGYNDSSI
jgi:SAM-dependent methyltransferase